MMSRKPSIIPKNKLDRSLWIKGRDNKVITDLCKENFCHVVINPHNLTNNFQPLDITVNKPAKSSIADK